MRLHRFYIREDIGSKKQVTIDSAELANQIRRVFRLRSGDGLIIFNGTGFDYECKIDGFGESDKIKGDNTIILSIISSVPSRFVPKGKLYLCSAIVKKDTFEWVVQKATELGVTDIIPMSAIRSEKKNLNVERLNKIAVEASEQSGRGDVPVIHDIMGVGDAVSFLRAEKADLLVFDTEGERFGRGSTAGKSGAKNSGQNIGESDAQNAKLGVFIGPEGGWAPEELAMFHEECITVCSLGSQVLRAETAVISALSMVVFS